jgi:predicted transcriptional regulator of viral defense system
VKEPRGARSLSRAEGRVVLALEAQGAETLSLRDIARLLGGASPSYARKLAFGLVRKGWIQRVGRGRYLLNHASAGPDAIPDTNPFRVGSHLVEPSYFGYATAANLHGLLAQTQQTYFVVTTSHKLVSVREPAEFRVVRVPKGKFFGAANMEKYGATIAVSNLEKTLLDCIARQDLAGGIPAVVQIIHAAKPNLDYSRLRSYLARLDNKSLAQRLGFLLERVRPEVTVPRSFLRFLHGRVGVAFVSLGSPAKFGSRGRHHADWRIVVNVPDPQLFGEVEVR